MESGGGGDDHALNFCVIENGVYIIGDGDGRIGFAHLFTDGRGGVADGFQNAQLVEITDEVLAPVAGADEGDGRSEELRVRRKG